ncbi:MAG: hypothetical protein ABR976_07410 [Terracidiphilus sp.]|jgi:hypothetical protein
MSRHNLLVTLLLLFPTFSPAQSVQTDQQAYCAYLSEQAKAQTDFLRAPTALGYFTQPDSGLPQQLVAGAQLSLSNLKKAGITLDVARKNCELYKASTGVMQRLQFALPSIEKDALHHRLDLIAQATQSLDELSDQTAKMVEAQNMTRPMLWELKTNRIKLNADRADTQSKIAAIYVPPLTTQPLKQQVAAKQAADVEDQKSLANLTRQNNWDVALTVGTHQQIDPVSQGPQPFGEVTVSYNLAGHAIDKHLDRSVTAYGDWKKVQEGDVARGMEELRQQVTEQIAAQQDRLKSLQQENSEVEKSLKLVTDAETSAALDFRNQLTSTKILLGVETGDATYRIEQLQRFLTENF